MKQKVFLFMLSLFALQVSAQSTQLKGSILDAEGEALIGASVLVVGTKTGTVSDLDGSFTLNLPEKARSIEVSYVGYKSQTVNVVGKTSINIVMLDDGKMLDDVVVVGYGVQKKATLIGAVSAISGESLNKRTVASLSTALQGTMPGVTVQQTSGEPGADGASIRVRGIGSINSTTAPLVLVDGIEMDMNQVDMTTVQSISVLKDAASASIYGSRASNGVVLITTKRGEEGKIKIAYNTYLSMQVPTKMPGVLNAADYLQAELNSWDNAGVKVEDDVRKAREKLIHEHRTLRPDNWERYDTDWKDATIADNALMQNHSLSLSGGNKDLKYFSSLSYLDQGGLIDNNNFDRLNIRVNTDANILPWLKLSNEISYRKSSQLTSSVGAPKGIINRALYMLPTLSAVKELDGKWGYGKNGDNPVARAQAAGTSTTNRPELLLNATVTMTPLAGLELQAQYSYRSTESRVRSVITPYETSIKGIAAALYPSSDGVTEKWSQDIRNFYRAQASYTKKINLHSAKLLAGFQGEDNLATNFEGTKKGFELDRYYLGNGDGSTATSNGGASNWAMASLYGRFNYEYDDKYLLEMSGRYDGSSRFISDNRWGFFPSIAGGWVVSKEAFMEDFAETLNHLKLRASFGNLGNQNIGNYPYASTVNTGWSYWHDKQLNTGVAQVRLSNPLVSWEKSRQTNFGIDAILFKDKLSATMDYYIKDVYDMLMIFPVPYYTGLNATYSNAGDMRNKGWEIALTYRDKVGEVSYMLTGTLSNNENKVMDLKGNTFTDHSIKENYAKGSYWGYVTDGYYADWDDVENSPKLSNSARPGYVKYVKTYTAENANPNQIEDKDKVYLGDPFPHYEYGLNIVAEYKNFDATVFFQGVGKRSAMFSGIGLRPFFGGSNLFKHQLDSWTPENPNAEYPILVPEANSADNFMTNDKWVKSGAYMRMKNVIVGYRMPKSWTNKIKFEHARFYVSAQNIFTLSSFQKGYDPEVSYDGGDFYPIMKTFTFGIDIKF